jgi:hypothetical protein
MRSPFYVQARRQQLGLLSFLPVCKIEAEFVSDLKKLAGTTRLELATSAVTGQRSNQLNYVPSFFGKLQESGFICWADDIPKQLHQFNR